MRPLIIPTGPGDIVDSEIIGILLTPDQLIYEADRMKVTGILGNDSNRMATVTLLREEYVIRAGHVFDIGILVKSISDDAVVLTIPMKGADDIELVKPLMELPPQ